MDGNPMVILFDIGSAAWKLHEWKEDLWRSANIGVPWEDIEVNDSLIFGFLSAWLLQEVPEPSVYRLRSLIHSFQVLNSLPRSVRLFLLEIRTNLNLYLCLVNIVFNAGASSLTYSIGFKLQFVNICFCCQMNFMAVEKAYCVCKKKKDYSNGCTYILLLRYEVHRVK